MSYWDELRKYAESDTFLGRSVAKHTNFGTAYGRSVSSQPSIQNIKPTVARRFQGDQDPFALKYLEHKACKVCSEPIPFYEAQHDSRSCEYGRVKKRQREAGYLPIQGIHRPIYRAAGVRLLQDLLRSTPETRDKRGNYKGHQRGSYAPAWAIILVEQAGLGPLTNPKRPRVKLVIERLQHAAKSPDEQQVILAEHILGGGPYTAVCRALIERTAG